VAVLALLQDKPGFHLNTPRVPQVPDQAFQALKPEAHSPTASGVMTA
jgi:hypothetical protein